MRGHAGDQYVGNYLPATVGHETSSQELLHVGIDKRVPEIHHDQIQNSEGMASSKKMEQLGVCRTRSDHLSKIRTTPDLGSTWTQLFSDPLQHSQKDYALLLDMTLFQKKKHVSIISVIYMKGKSSE